jgi:NADH-ubiquinone oxidoreductase chain 2
MAGVPPLVGFFGKQMVLYSATHSGYYFLSFVAIIVSVISASYYLKIVRVIHFDTGNVATSSQSDKLGNVHSFLIATLTMAITLFVFKPSIILNSTSLLALTLFHY